MEPTRMPSKGRGRKRNTLINNSPRPTFNPPGVIPVPQRGIRPIFRPVIGLTGNTPANRNAPQNLPSTSHNVTNEVQQVSIGVNQLSTDDAMVPLKSGSDNAKQNSNNELPISIKRGTSGTAIMLKANYFPITTYANWCLYQYKVEFSPEEDRIGVKRGLLAAHANTLEKSYLFDGENLFSHKRFDPENFELTSKRDSDGVLIVISLKLVKIVNKNEVSYIQVFNLLVRKCLKHLNLKAIRRNYYDPEAKIDFPHHRLQLWPGYDTSIGIFENGLLLRAEITSKIMRQQTVYDLFLECLNQRHRNEDWMNYFKASVIGTTIMTLFNNLAYKIDDVDENKNPSSEFVRKDGSKISYIDYYKQKWGIDIRNKNQPMLISIKKKNICDAKSEDVLIYLVPELCTMTGLTTGMRNDFRLMQDLAVYTRYNPRDRIQRLNNFMHRLSSNVESVNELKKWNLTLSNSLVDVPGRIIKSQDIYNKNLQSLSGNTTDWTGNLRSSPMFMSATIKLWVILTPEKFYSYVIEFVKTLIKVANNMSFKVPTPNIVTMGNVQPQSYLTHLEKIVNSSNPNLILCVIPGKRDDLYNLIKRKLCIDRAVPSQVVLSKNIEKNNMSVVTKIAIQINCKLGGAPWLVNIPKQNMMIIGYDVCHCKPNKSYGAFVATMNDHHTTYFSCVDGHDNGNDLSSHFFINTSKALIKYKEKNGCLPTSIVVYRDGVGDGQIGHVKDIELVNLKAACKKLYGEKPFPLAFIIVTKRISTKFFTNMSENPPPGTVVDNTVTDPSKYDFFIVSQHVRNGTVTPTHYHIIEDTINLKPDIMQLLTYKLTHMYYNWSGTIRVPAPCQLAHKLAFLTGQALRGIPNSSLDEYLYYL